MLVHTSDNFSASNSNNFSASDSDKVIILVLAIVTTLALVIVMTLSLAIVNLALAMVQYSPVSKIAFLQIRLTESQIYGYFVSKFAS